MHAAVRTLTVICLITLISLATTSRAIETLNPGPNAAQINGAPGSPGRDIFAVRFTEINGDTIAPREVLWLAPGVYQIEVLIDERFTTAPRRFNRQPNRSDDYVTFELELEAGKRYDIRGRFNRNDRANPYDVIVDRVSD